MYMVFASICGFSTFYLIRRRWPRFPWWGLLITLAPYMAIAIWLLER